MLLSSVGVCVCVVAVAGAGAGLWQWSPHAGGGGLSSSLESCLPAYSASDFNEDLGELTARNLYHAKQYVRALQVRRRPFIDQPPPQQQQQHAYSLPACLAV